MHVVYFSFPGAAEKAAKDGEDFKKEAVTDAIKQRMRERQRVKEKSFDMIRCVTLTACLYYCTSICLLSIFHT
jgi:hypothetical protein